MLIFLYMGTITEDEEVRYTHSKDILSLSQHLMDTLCVLSPFKFVVSISPRHILSIFRIGD